MHEKFAAEIIGIRSQGIGDDKIGQWSDMASRRFVEDGTPLNDTIQKIANDNDLGPNFIERICEAANLLTHARTIPSSPMDRAGFSFPLADARAVMRSFRRGPMGPRMVSDFAAPPSGLPGRGPSMAEMFGVNENGNGNDDCLENRDAKRKILVVIEKKAALRQRVKDLLIKEAMMFKSEEKRVHYLVKEAVMAGHSMESLHAASCSAGTGDVSQVLFPKTAQLLRRQMILSDGDIEKLAFPAPEELIDRNVPMTIVNGRQALLSSIDALKKHTKNMKLYRGALVHIDDDLGLLRQKLKEI